MKASIFRSVSLSALAIGCAIVSCPATAQVADPAVSPEQAAPDAPPQAADIIVTGSRIARKDYTAQSPIVTTDAEDIAVAGTSTVDSYLRQLPQFQPGSGDFSNSASGGTVGQATLNLRGLGAQRNLILMDGRRLQPSNPEGVIDINTIPTLAIGNVEVISGGASATYGSDAMSGVVNFKIRTDLRGLELFAQGNVTGRGDGASRQLGFAYGTKFADGRGSLLLSGEYVDRDGVGTLARRFSRGQALSGFIPQGLLVPDGGNLPSQAVVTSVFSGYGVSAAVPRTSFFGFNNDGTLFRRNAPAGSFNYRGPTTGPFISTPTLFGYDGSYYNFIQTPLERYTVFGRGEYEVSDGITLYAQGSYAHSKARNQGSEPVLATPWDLRIPVTNPFIPADLARVLASRPQPNAPITYFGRVSQAGPRSFTTETETWQALVGLRGEIASLGWTWDIYGSHGEANTSDTTTAGAVSVGALRRLINAADGGSGLCAGGYNPFGLEGLSSACLAYVSRTPINRTSINQDVVEGVLQGGLFNVPAGEVRFAASANYRRNGYLFVPDSDVAAGDITSISATQRTTGSTRVAEGAIELLLPILADLPFIRALNVTLGYRYSDYRLSGGAHTYKADFDWRVAEPLMFRGGYQRALRAPNIGEYFLAGNQTVSQIGTPPGGGDPCDVRSNFRAPSNANAAQVRSLCIATGLNAALADSFQQPTTAAVTTTIGNGALKPEKADTFTFGAVLTSPFSADALRNISLSVDYYDIKIANAIAVLGATTSLQKCFNGDGSNSSYSASNYFCGLFQRDGTGLFTSVSQPYLNLGGYRTAGIDVQLDWRVPLDFLSVGGQSGSITLASYANYLDKFEIQTLPGGPFQENAGTISTATSFPRWKLVNSLTIDAGPFSVSGRWRYIDAMADASTITNPATTIPNTPSYNYFDLSLKIAPTDKYELRLGINNLTDKRPPVVGGTLGVTNPGVYDVLGRSFYASAKARF